MTRIEVKAINPSFMTIDKTTFKYYLSLEMDRALIIENKISDSEVEINHKEGLTPKEVNELYFKICERFEPYFKEVDEDNE
jgi:hypothetical protein